MTEPVNSGVSGTHESPGFGWRHVPVLQQDWTLETDIGNSQVYESCSGNSTTWSLSMN
jgi:hypothetical protein